MPKYVYFCLMIVTVIIFFSSTVTAQTIVIVQNSYDPEIDSLQSYLYSMGLNSKVFTNDYLVYDSIANYDLLIWNDLSYQMGGITDNNVSIFQQFHQSGKPLYLIGDDLAYSIINLSPDWATVWTDLLHLAGVNNFSQSYTVYITNTQHPVTNGPYGQVNNFDYSLDIDLATRTNTGEDVLATTTDSDVLLVYEGTYARTVTQNCLVIQAGSDSSIVERKKIFKNAVAWLLEGYNGVNEKEQNLPAKEFSLSQNYPNPFNPSTTISFALSSKSFVSLKVFDTLGREVVTLVSEELNAGIYSTPWNTGDLPSGIYIYRLQAGAFAESKKMILMR